jgi:regulator of chromosome condensation
MAPRRAKSNAAVPSNNTGSKPSSKAVGARVSCKHATGTGRVTKSDAISNKSRTNRSRQKPAAPTRKLDHVLNNAPRTRLQVFVCGEGSAGELGLGPHNATDVRLPRVNPNLAGVVSVATGGMHAAALTADNEILTWGINDLFTLGRDTPWDGGVRDIHGEDEASNSDSGSGSGAELNPKESTPTAIPSSSFPPGTRFVQVAAGDSTTFALTEDGFVYGWGTFRVSERPPFLSVPSCLLQPKGHLLS